MYTRPAGSGGTPADEEGASVGKLNRKRLHQKVALAKKSVISLDHQISGD